VSVVQADGDLGAARMLCAAVEAFVSSASRLTVTEPGAHLRFGALFYGLGADIARAEQAGLTREQIREMVAPVRDLFARSPFVRRAQAWPRGYPGDFETIEQVISQANRAPEGTVEWLIESYCLGSPFARQHRNKVAHQARLITDVILRPGPGPRVLLIAAGAAPDLRLVPGQIAGHGGRLVLHDYDPAALDLARDLLGLVARCCTFIPGNVLRALPALAARAPMTWSWPVGCLTTCPTGRRGSQPARQSTGSANPAACSTSPTSARATPAATGPNTSATGS
jgi:hypothetical protein